MMKFKRVLASTLMLLVILFSFDGAFAQVTTPNTYWKESKEYYLNSRFGDETSVKPEETEGKWETINEQGSLYKEYDFDSGAKDLYFKSGNVKIVDGELVNSTVKGTSETFFGNEIYSDFEIEFDLTMTESGGGGSVSLGARYKDSDNRISFMFTDAKLCQVVRVQDGVKKYPVTIGGIETGKKTNIKIKCYGRQHDIYIDGKLKNHANEQMIFPEGKLGILSWNMAYKLDNVKIKTPKAYGYGKKYAHLESGEKALALVGKSDMENISVTTDMSLSNSNGGGIAVRADKNGNGYFAVMDGKYARIEKRQDGKISVLGRTKLETGDYEPITYKLIADNEKLILEADNKQILSVKDKDFKSGYAAMFSDGSCVVYNNIIVQKLKGLFDTYNSKGNTAYYISADGDDSNSGTSEDKAWKSIDKVNSVKLAPGDKVLFRKGDEFYGYLKISRQMGGKDAPIVYGSYGDAETLPVLTNFGQVMYLTDSSYITVENLGIFVQTNAGRTDNFGSATGIIIRAHQQWYPNEVMEDITVRNCEVYSSHYDTNTSGITIGVEHVPGTYEAEKDSFIRNMKIENNYTHDLGVYGIGALSWNMAKGGGEMYVPGLITKAHVAGNRIERVSSIGMCINGYSDSVIERNVVRRGGAYDKEDTPNWGVGDGFIGNSSYTVVQFNDFGYAEDGHVGIDAGGFGLDYGIHDVTYQYNENHYNMGTGLHTMGNRDNKILYNKMHHNYELTSAVGGVGITDYKGTGDIKGQKNMFVKGNVVTLNFDHTVGIATQNTSNNPYVGVRYEDNTIVIPKVPEQDEMTKTHTKSKAAAYYNSADSVQADGPMRLVFDIPKGTAVESITGTKVFTEDGFKAAKDGMVYNSREEWLEATGYDDELSVVNSIDYSKLPKPGNFKVTAGAGGTQLSWDAVPGAAHYNLYRGEMPDFESRYITMIGEARDGATTFTDTCEQEEGKTYYYRVEAENECGIDGESSDTLSVVAENTSESSISAELSKEMKYLAREGIIKDGRPNDIITRAEAVIAAIRDVGLETTEYKNIYADTSGDDWYASAVQTANDYAIVPPEMIEDRQFKADRAISREEAAAVIFRLTEISGAAPGGEERQFNDEGNISQWAYYPCKKLAEFGIIEGDDNNCFNPGANITREDFALMLYRFIRLTGR